MKASGSGRSILGKIRWKLSEPHIMKWIIKMCALWT